MTVPCAEVGDLKCSPCLQQYNSILPFQLSPPHFLDLEIFSNFKIIDYTFTYPGRLPRHVHIATSVKQL